jgi:DNA-directed RNA polymerase subunit M/transcription elongation factor TFIIS
MKFCPECENYLYPDSKSEKLLRVCRNCGYSEEDKSGGLVMETIVQERSSEGYKILINEFTRQDPTLPHVTTLPCPNTNGYEEKDEDGTVIKRIEACPTNKGGAGREVIIIKYDNQNMKFIYICNVCGTQWRSRS